MIQQNFTLPKGTLMSQGSRLETVELYRNVRQILEKRRVFPKINIFQQISGSLWDAQNWLENSEKIPTQFSTIQSNSIS